jgi:hypothetical protein
MVEMRRGAVVRWTRRSSSVSIDAEIPGATPAVAGTETTGAGGAIGRGGSGFVGWIVFEAGEMNPFDGGADMMGRVPPSAAILMDGTRVCGRIFSGRFSSDMILGTAVGVGGGRKGARGAIGSAAGTGEATVGADPADEAGAIAENIPRKSSPGARVS